jgi:hypothetical protein
VKKDAAALVEEFADSVVKQSEAILTGTTKEARYYGKKPAPIARKLLGMGDEAVRQFASLLCHPVRRVRVVAAVYLFTSLPDDVLAALKEVAEGDDFAALCAQLRIKEWEEHPEHYDESNWV